MKSFITLLITVTMPVMLWAQTFKVVELDGDVRYRGPKKFKTNPVKVDQDLEAGGRIRIQKDGRLVLTTPKQHRIELNGDTYMRLDELTQKSVSLELFKGINMNKVNTLKDDEAFLVRTPTAVVGVRGTEFQCAVEENGNTEVNVIEGIVGVRDIDAQFAEVDVSVGKSATVTSDGTVSVREVPNIEQRVERNSNQPGGRFEAAPRPPEAPEINPIENVIESASTNRETQKDEINDVIETVISGRTDSLDTGDLGGVVDMDRIQEIQSSNEIASETEINATIESINR